ncbi:MAG TPA: hypothetical protein VF741_03865 [Candidatus Aquilonibacter sp.]
MKVACNHVVGVPGMRDGLVPAVGAVVMLRVVSGTLVARGARAGVWRGCAKLVLVNMPFMRMMQVIIVQIVRVSVMLDGRVTACLSVRVSMTVVG